MRILLHPSHPTPSTPQSQFLLPTSLINPVPQTTALGPSPSTKYQISSPMIFSSYQLTEIILPLFSFLFSSLLSSAAFLSFPAFLPKKFGIPFGLVGVKSVLILPIFHFARAREKNETEPACHCSLSAQKCERD